MAWTSIPLTNHPDQIVLQTVEVGGTNIPLKIHVRWNWTCEFWYMSVTDVTTGNLLVDSIPLVTGNYPAANLLEAYKYLGIGSAIIVPTCENPSSNFPNRKNLGTEFQLWWGEDDQ